MVEGNSDDISRNIKSPNQFEPDATGTPSEYVQTQKLTFIEKAKGFILSPTETFKRIKGEDLGDGLIYLLIWLLIYGALSVIVSIVIWDYMSSLGGL